MTKLKLKPLAVTEAQENSNLNIISMKKEMKTHAKILKKLKIELKHSIRIKIWESNQGDLANFIMKISRLIMKKSHEIQNKKVVEKWSAEFQKFIMPTFLF